jgi:hypothetical protein
MADEHLDRFTTQKGTELGLTKGIVKEFIGVQTKVLED